MIRGAAALAADVDGARGPSPGPRPVPVNPRRKEERPMSDWNTAVIEEFRTNGGKVGGTFEHVPLLLLHTTGAKTGKERINPLAYQAVGNDVAVFASKGGSPTHPDWYRNLVADPRATIELGNDTFPVRARVAEGEERERIWRLQKELLPGFADYEQKTSRQIPVIVLERAS
jgi:deazaflavin-dependent oxidoreductase (nitroreductase family)